MLTAWILYAYVYTVLIFDIARFASYMLVKYYCYSDPSFYLFFIFIYLFIFFWGGQKIAIWSNARVSSLAPVLFVG